MGFQRKALSVKSVKGKRERKDWGSFEESGVTGEEENLREGVRSIWGAWVVIFKSESGVEVRVKERMPFVIEQVGWMELPEVN